MREQDGMLCRITARAQGHAANTVMQMCVHASATIARDHDGDKVQLLRLVLRLSRAKSLTAWCHKQERQRDRHL